MNLIIFFAVVPLQIIHNVSNKKYIASNLDNASMIAAEEEFTRFYGDDQRSVTSNSNKVQIHQAYKDTNDSRNNNFDFSETNATYEELNFDNSSEIHDTNKASIDKGRNKNITEITDDSSKYRINLELIQYYNNTLTNLQKFRINKKSRTVEVFNVNKKFYQEIFQGNEQYFLIVTVPIVSGVTLVMVYICYRLRVN